MNSETIRELQVEPDEADQRLDAYLAARQAQSRGVAQKWITQGAILVNGQTAKASHRLRVGDTVTFSESILAETPDRPQVPAAENIPLSVLHADSSCIVINKPAGMLVHPDTYTDRGTIVHGILALFPEVAAAVYDPDSPVSCLRPGIVHRLDRDTSGVLVVARTRPALENLADQFRQHQVEKEYVALLFGTVGGPVTVDAPIRRKPGRQNRMGIGTPDGEGKPARTHFLPEQYYRYHHYRFTWCVCRIDTGRTHQIRVHAKTLGHPVLGDPLYHHRTSQAASRQLGLTRQFLHAARLSFRHPDTGERLTFTAPLPDDLKTALHPLQADSEVC
jgi:23S rRNA pseudouridine1911/1915/1917 synthase